MILPICLSFSCEVRFAVGRTVSTAFSRVKERVHRQSGNVRFGDCEWGRGDARLRALSRCAGNGGAVGIGARGIGCIMTKSWTARARFPSSSLLHEAESLPHLLSSWTLQSPIWPHTHRGGGHPGRRRQPRWVADDSARRDRNAPLPDRNRLARNFGQTAALSAGFDAARSQVWCLSTGSAKRSRRRP